MKVSNITIGADPELFLINKETKKVVSAVGIIPGEKGKPYRNKKMPKGFGLETDNILAEFNIPPVTNETDFVDNILYMQNYIRNFVASKNLDILCAASQIVDDDQLQSPQAKLFGCDVDYNAYTGQANPKPKGEKTNLRSAGFHIHIGYKNPSINTSLGLVRYLDAYLGIPSILIDKDTRRRTLYGKAGCFRITSYGVEYRVLSSYLMSNISLISWVYKQVMQAIDKYEEGNLERDCWNSMLIESKDIKNVINNNDTNKALAFCKYLKIELPCAEYLG